MAASCVGGITVSGLGDDSFINTFLSWHGRPQIAVGLQLINLEKESAQTWVVLARDPGLK